MHKYCEGQVKTLALIMLFMHEFASFIVFQPLIVHKVILDILSTTSDAYHDHEAILPDANTEIVLDIIKQLVIAVLFIIYTKITL